ncbi:zincin [Neocallimastix sp. 'constans']|jgi:predicted metalloendopeptidase
MNYKNIHVILSFISLSLVVSSSPISKGCFFGKSMKNEEDNDDVCSTPECFATSERILKYMNEEVDPCDDFFEFACGNYIKTAIIPDDQSSISNIVTLYNDNVNITRDILEGEYKGINNSTSEQQNLDEKSFNQLKSLYNSCMDEQNIKSKGRKPLVDLLNQLEIYKNKDTYKEVNGLTTLISKLGIYKAPILFGIDGLTDLWNSSDKEILLKQTDLGLPSKEYYEQEEAVTKYKEIIKAMLSNILDDENQDSGNFFTKLFGGSDKRDFDKLANSIVEFEKKLINVVIPPEQMYDTSIYQKFNIQSLSEKFPYINWPLYFETIFGLVNMKNTVNENSQIIVYGSTYFDGLNNILKETDVETLTAYAEWRVINVYGNYISDEFKEPLKIMDKLLYGVESEPVRYEYCVNTVDSSMGMALGRFFVDEVFDNNSRKMAEDLLGNIKEVLKERIPKMSWIDKQSSKLAIEKVEAINPKIGYPDFIMDPIKLDEKYKGLEIVNNDFFTNMVNSSKHDVRRILMEVNKPTDKSTWEMTPYTINAYYHPMNSEICFPAGILRDPFFSSTNPSYINYGAIGAVMGHEITHAFDNNGRNFDKNGKLSNWWTNSTTEEFNKLTQCYIEQYGNYTVEGDDGIKLNINGKLTLGENLADNGGLARSYDAYKRSLSKKKSENNNQLLPNLTKYSKDQLFYISYGQSYCGKFRPEYLINQVHSNPHSPNKVRVNGPLSNSKEFAKAFKCKSNSPMNPEKKCSMY